MFGYHGKLMVVDLNTESWYLDDIQEDVFSRFLGGVGLGAYLLYRYSKPNTDPLDPANPLIFACSPLVGSRLTTSSKFAVVTKSPLTNLIGDSLSSSFLATALKGTGCDALIINGKATSTKVLKISQDGVEFLPGSDLKGISTLETEKRLKEKFGRFFRIACIGPAGENLVKFASITNDGGRQAARTGPGAVMGSKNLKAIAVKGNNPIPVFDQNSLENIGQNLTKKSLGPATEKYRTLGTIANVSVFNRLGVLPTLNFQQSTFEQADEISGESISDSHLISNAHCANCTIGCERILTTNDSKEVTKSRMEYESLFALGPLLGISDPNIIIRAASFCDLVGMDSISAGVSIAWAVETFEKGLISLDETDGVTLKFNDEKTLMFLLELISKRQGIGNLLAEGTRIASQKIGKGSEQWAMHVKGLEMPGYEPRNLKTMALALTVSTRGACHNRASAYEADFSANVDRTTSGPDRGMIVKESEDFSAVIDSLIWCKFLRKAFDDFYEESSEIFYRVTGIKMTANELKMSGERINNLRKMFNIREGWTRSDDTLPSRVTSEVLPTGVSKGVGLSVSELNQMIDSYYYARGWSKDGNIPSKKIDELGLSDIM